MVAVSTFASVLSSVSKIKADDSVEISLLVKPGGEVVEMVDWVDGVMSKILISSTAK